MLDDTPQPDLHLRILPECGGSSQEDDGYLGGIPELLAANKTRLDRGN